MRFLLQDCYNVQPGVIIDYSDGSNRLDRNYKADQSQNGKITFTLDEFTTTGNSNNTENVSKGIGTEARCTKLVIMPNGRTQFSLNCVLPFSWV